MSKIQLRLWPHFMSNEYVDSIEFEAEHLSDNDKLGKMFIHADIKYGDAEYVSKIVKDLEEQVERHGSIVLEDVKGLVAHTRLWGSLAQKLIDDLKGWPDTVFTNEPVKCEGGMKSIIPSSWMEMARQTRCGNE